LSTTDASDATDLDRRIAGVLQQYWGFEALRPLQAEAIQAGVQQRDSLVVLPTGGGKSLCYQVPPLVEQRMDVVVSPLIALMKDQVDGLTQCGYPAAAIHSHLDDAQREHIRQGLREQRYRLLFVTPERLLNRRFLDFLDRQQVRSFAIDEAHCISQWGHDFRQEYRQLASLKSRFPNASVHAYTATATARVQQDIIEQLGLNAPRVIVGRFDRPNLVYRVLPAQGVHAQTLEAVRRHPSEAVIVYCLSRNDTEAMAAYLREHNVRAAHYHAGMEKPQRRQVQDDFTAERVDVVAATVAFGMGIDRSNVRCVVHATMPKSVEHYQQETGRAGRDGLEAECVLLYSGRDAVRWDGLIRKSAEEAAAPDKVINAQLQLLGQMQGFANTLQCRHRALSQHFGQQYKHDNCQACDVCLGEIEPMAESTTIAQKVLSCVYRLGQPYGAKHIVQVLRGAATQPIRNRGHDRLSTYGLLREIPDKRLQHIVYQLVDLGLLERTSREYATLQLTTAARDVLRGERQVDLIDPKTHDARRSRADEDAWAGVDQQLFDALREQRRDLAQQRGVPPYMILNDATLRNLARVRPTSWDTIQQIRGLGQKKREAFGQLLLDTIQAHCEAHEISTEVTAALDHAETSDARQANKRPNPQKEQAMTLFAQGHTLMHVAETVGRAQSTTAGYLAEYIEQHRPQRIDAWVDANTYQRIIDAAGALGVDRLRPIFEYLNEQVDYAAIKVTLAHHQAMNSDASAR
jgi:ATP-dependent DNA helicase RecQ